MCGIDGDADVCVYVCACVCVCTYTCVCVALMIVVDVLILFLVNRFIRDASVLTRLRYECGYRCVYLHIYI